MTTAHTGNNHIYVRNSTNMLQLTNHRKRHTYFLEIIQILNGECNIKLKICTWAEETYTVVVASCKKVVNGE